MGKSEICWFCGGRGNTDGGNIIEHHHLIPVRLNPVTNVSIPMHRDCHKKVIHALDDNTPKDVKDLAGRMLKDANNLYTIIKKNNIKVLLKEDKK